ncbi:flagellar biosynthesis anti-sigma factor FlgM [Alkalicoccus daliensis]|uniref:Negative regulator of flagellin synthesis n=1 Tax=Alkalicoccus daliensis TaxID=745820 RepID=A0A1H0J1B1_9BACI|nr:flagellar biosynthesis anti-sigma factor FlgM [Alkalicoccus daliensis]SDO37495.1 anti-sigma-28 factor, FlgM family [Alkalicoccus daliensis]
MKINPMHSLNAYNRSQETQRSKETQQPQKSDRIEISKAAQEMAKSQEFQAARNERVQELKEQVENDKYQVNSQDVARKMYDFWNS